MPAVEALLPCLLELGRFPERRSTLILLACERLAPERVAAHLRSAVGVDNLLETNGVITLIKDLLECGVNLCGVDHEWPRRSMPDMQELFFDALKTVAAALAGPLRGVPSFERPTAAGIEGMHSCDLLLPFCRRTTRLRGEQALAFWQKMGDDLFGDGDGHRLRVLGPGLGAALVLPWGLVALRVASRHAVRRAWKTRRARAQSYCEPRASPVRARGARHPEFATGLTPWLTNALPAPRPLTVLTTCDATPREYLFLGITKRRGGVAHSTPSPSATAAPDSSVRRRRRRRLASEVYDNMWPRGRPNTSKTRCAT